MANVGQYKKTYEGDYTKSYRNHVEWLKESMEKRRIYEAVSKKTNTKYNKTERSVYENITEGSLSNSERVFADGSRYRKEENKPSKRKWEEPYSSPTSRAVEAQQTVSTSHSTAADIAQALREKYPQQSQSSKQQSKPIVAKVIEEEEDDGNYNYIDYPVQQIGVNKYKNMKTGKIMDADEARDLLKVAGFAPKPKSSIGTIIFGFIILFFIFPNIASFVVIGYGIYTMLRGTTQWIKHTSNKFLKLSIEASQAEAQTNKGMGIFFIIIGVFTLIYKFINL